MIRRSVIRTAAMAAALLVLLAPPALAQPALEGRWVLVKQTYGKGEANLAEEGSPVCLEFYADGGQQAARAWRLDEPSTTWGWPVWLAEGKPLPLRLLHRSVDPGAGEVSVRYTVRPSPGDSLVLEVEESYRLEEGGAALVGTVEAVFRVGEETRGGFVVHRRFERMP